MAFLVDPPPKPKNNTDRLIPACAADLKPCVHFVDEKVDNIDFNSKDSEIGWQKLVNKSGCDAAEAEQYCEKYRDTIFLVPRLQFRRCKVADKTRNRICKNRAMTVCMCRKCGDAVDQARQLAHLNSFCDAGDAPVQENCTVPCGIKLFALPDGYECESSGSCLLGKCYRLSSMDCSKKEINCTVKT